MLDIPRKDSNEVDGRRYGEWTNYVKGPKESLKNINDALTELRCDGIHKFVNSVFDDIDKELDENTLEECQKIYDDKIGNILKPIDGRNKINDLILLLFYHRMYFEWETSLRHDPIHILHNALRRHYLENSFENASQERKDFIARFFDVFQIMAYGIRVENALNVNCPLGILEHSKKVSAVSSVKLAASGYDAHEQIVIDWLEKEIEDGRIYFDAISAVSVAVLAWQNNDSNWRDVADRAAQTAVKARKELLDTSYFYATELDAHLKTLRSLQGFGDASQCRVDYFKVVYCFPFVIPDLDTHTLRDKTETLKQAWKSRSEAGKDGFAKAFKPTSFEEVELTDVWTAAAGSSDAATRGEKTPPDESGEIFYNLYAINFQNIVIRDVQNLEKAISLRCQIRLSSFGNHHVRFYAAQGDERDFDRLDQIDGHELHRILRRSSSLCGKEPICSEDETYRNYEESAYLARTNLLGIAERLVKLFGEVLRETYNARLEYDFAKTSRVIFSLEEFSAADDRKPEEAAKRESALGRIFMNPIGGPADRLEPWLSRSVPEVGRGDEGQSARSGMQVIRNLARSELGEDAAIYATANTTLIRLPSHSHFVRLDYEEMAEFVATIQPVYSDLAARIGDTVEKASKLLKAEARHESPETADALHLELLQLAAHAQKKILDLDSPAIVTNSVYRDYLDDLIKYSSARQWHETLQHKAAAAQDVVIGLAERVRKEADDRTHRWRHRWGIGIAVAAVIVSVAQLADLKSNYANKIFGGWWAVSSSADNPNSAADRSPSVKTTP